MARYPAGPFAPEEPQTPASADLHEWGAGGGGGYVQQGAGVVMVLAHSSAAGCQRVAGV
jgi:hypothetical protein